MSNLYDVTFYSAEWWSHLADFQRAVALNDLTPNDRAIAVSKWDGEVLYWDGRRWTDEKPSELRAVENRKEADMREKLAGWRMQKFDGSARGWELVRGANGWELVVHIVHDDRPAGSFMVPLIEQGARILPGRVHAYRNCHLGMLPPQERDLVEPRLVRAAIGSFSRYLKLHETARKEAA